MTHPDDPVTQTANSGKTLKRWISPFHARGTGTATFSRAHIRGPLTDRKIEKYRKLGRYSAEYREARREAMSKRHTIKRRGAFVEVEPGRLIYSPL